MDFTPQTQDSFSYFQTGYVIDCDPKNCTCSVSRSEGGRLDNVPILNTFGSGGQATDVGWTKKLRGCYVLLVNVQGVLCVLATIPMFGKMSEAVV